MVLVTNMSEEKNLIKKLSNANYATWATKVEWILIRDGLLKYVTEDPPAVVTNAWTTGDGKARATIGLLIEDSQLVHLRGLNSAKAFWDKLKTIHTRSSFTAKILVLKQLCRKTLNEGDSMEDHLESIFHLVDKLAGYGEELKQNMVVALILCSLPETYNPLINSLEGRNEAELTVDIVREKLLEEYGRRKETSSTNETALKVSKPKYNKKVKVSKEIVFIATKKVI